MCEENVRERHKQFILILFQLQTKLIVDLPDKSQKNGTILQWWIPTISSLAGVVIYCLIVTVLFKVR